MTYLVFDGDETPVLVEVADRETAQVPGMVKAGVGDRLKDGLVQARVKFGDALTTLIDLNAGAFVRAVKSLEDVPDEVEIEFSVKATGELGNFAVGKLSGESNYRVKLLWRSVSQPHGDD
jgi:hypothetical protein